MHRIIIQFSLSYVNNMHLSYENKRRKTGMSTVVQERDEPRHR